MTVPDAKAEQVRLASRFDDLCLEMDYSVLSRLDAWAVAMAHARLDAVMAEGPMERRARTARLSIQGFSDLLKRWEVEPGLAAIIPLQERTVRANAPGKEAAKRKVEARLARISEKSRQSAERRRSRPGR